MSPDATVPSAFRFEGYAYAKRNRNVPIILRRMIVLPSEGYARGPPAHKAAVPSSVVSAPSAEGVSRRTARHEKQKNGKTIMLQRLRDRAGPPGTESPKQRRRMKECTVVCRPPPLFFTCCRKTQTVSFRICRRRPLLKRTRADTLQRSTSAPRRYWRC